jgi:hypothetical protein
MRSLWVRPKAMNKIISLFVHFSCFISVYKILSKAYESEALVIKLKSDNDDDTNALGGYSQNFFTKICKFFVTLTWILELISHQK